jgi:Repeat of unknown function (DUF5907)
MPSHIYDLQDTWNAGGVVFNGIKIDVNNAASAIGSRLFRVDTNGAPQFAVDPVAGAVVGAAAGGPMGPGTINATSYYLNGVLIGTGVSDGDKGDIIVSSSGTVWTIDAGVVSYAKMQNVSATGRVLGRFSAGAGVVEEGTGAQVNALLPIFTDTVKGLVPPSAGGTATFLRADGTFATPPGGGGGSGLADAYQVITDGAAPASAIGAGTFKLRTSAPLTVATENVNATHGKNALFSFAAGAFGDIVISAGAWTIGPRAVTYAKMPSMAVSKLAGRGSAAGAGDIEEITLGTNLTMSGTTLNATGGGAGGFTSSSTAPPAPVAGDRWYNPDTGVTATYINDGNSSQWVQTAPTVSPPSANGFAGVNVQVFPASGTYTPTPGMKYCQIECVGGGGGGGGTGDFTGFAGGGAGGGSGGYSRKTVPAITIGASQSVIIGAGGTAGAAAGVTVAGAGGVTSVGSICIANGGAGGPGYGLIGTQAVAGGAGGTAGTGDIAVAGNPGAPAASGNIVADGANSGAGHGGASFFGGAGRCGAPAAGGTSQVGSPGTCGGGGGGGCSINTATARAGGVGGPGLVVITEYF